MKKERRRTHDIAKVHDDRRQPPKRRRKRKSKRQKRKEFIQDVIYVVGILLIVNLLLGCIGLVFVNSYYKKITGSSIMECRAQAKEMVEESTEDNFCPNQTSYIYSNNGTLIKKLSEGASSNYLKFENIPEHVVNAFIAVEDQSFYKNPGYDIKGIVRVLFNFFKSSGETAHGASTITQQLARTTFLTTERSIERKVREIFISYYITKKYSKEKIMEYYVNNCCFANSVYGIEDAAKTYFSKSASELTLAETAYLCAIPNRPTAFDPFADPTAALSRKNKILKDMQSCGYITKEECNEALNEEIEIKAGNKASELYDYPTTYAVHCAVRYLMKLHGFKFKYHFKSDDAYDEYKKEYDETYENMQHELYTGGYKIYTALSIKKTKKLQKILDNNLDFNITTNLSTRTYNLQGSITIINNETHKVVAVVGGRSDYQSGTTYSLNRVYQSRRQPGSTIKPLLVYTPAMDMGIATASTSLKNINVETAYSNPSQIENLGGDSVSLRYAVHQSLNGCALYLYNKVTPQKGIPYLEKLHFENISKNDYHLSSGLGGMTYGTNTSEMANAYYTIYNHGKYSDVDCINSMLDKDGNEIYKYAKQKQVYSQEAADTMTSIMKGVISEGTAWRMSWSSSSNLPAAGKTGTTNDMNDGWFCGFTPYYTISVWVGNDDNTPVVDNQGATYPASIWKESMLLMTKGKDHKDFKLGNTIN